MKELAHLELERLSRRNAPILTCQIWKREKKIEREREILAKIVVRE